MPAITQPYEVLLDFTNDTHDCATIQLLRDYGRNTSAVVLLYPGESLTLVLEAGSMYKYALKSHSKVANPAHRRGLLLYVGPRVRPPAASPLTEYGGTIGSMFGMMLEASPFDERLYPEGQKP